MILKYLILLLSITYLSYILESCGSEQNATADTGKDIFEKKCVLCHGADGKQQLNGASNLAISTLSLPNRIHVIANGRGTGMAAYKSQLTAEQIAKVAEYTGTLKKK